MTSSRRPQLRDAATAMILEVFRLNSQLVVAGDRLVAHLDLTSARWQVLSAAAAADPAQPVAWLARDLGMHRQGVQRITHDLVRAGLVELVPNPHHRRASLVVLTRHGRQTFEAAVTIYDPWVERLAHDFSAAEFASALRVITGMRRRLHAMGGEGEEDG